MILHLIRHPRPLIAPGICYGQLDIPAENPALLAASLKQKLPPDMPVWSSPLQRCRALAEALHPAPQFDDRLMEMNFGEWEGRAWDEVPRQALDDWAADVVNYAPPGGESPQQVLQRVLAFFAERHAESLVVVTHAGVIRLLLAHQQQQPLAALLDYPVPYGGVLSIHPLA